MDEFKMSAFARYPDGSSGDAFAAVSAGSLVTCFGAMAAEVASWLPQALACGEGEEPPPQAIELTLEWSGAPAQTPAPDGPEAPSDPARCNGRQQRPGLSCATRRLGCAGVTTLPLQAGARGGLPRARA